MSLASQFTAALEGKIAAGDDMAAAIAAWTGGDDMPKIITRCVMDLPLSDRLQFLAAWRADWDLFILVHEDHSELAQIEGWARARSERIVLLATSSGPTPPAVLTVEPP